MGPRVGSLGLWVCVRVRLMRDSGGSKGGTKVGGFRILNLYPTILGLISFTLPSFIATF